MAKLVFLLNEGCNDFGTLCVRDSYDEYSEPKRHVLYWPVMEGSRKAAAEVFPELDTDKELTKSGEVYHFYRGMGNYSPTVRLTEGGRTKAVKVEILDIPPPKVRKSVDTRFRNGTWEKYLKAKGWVIA